MSAFRFIVDDISTEIQNAFRGKGEVKSVSAYDKIAQAASGAVKQAGDLLKSKVRANIASGGFGSKWQNAWRVTFWPKDGHASVNAAVTGFHKIPYSNIFETGGTISGKGGLLWLPLPTAPKKVGRGKPTPRSLAAKGVKLFSMRRSGGPPLLATSVRMGANASTDKRFSLTTLTRGNKGGGKRAVARAIPLFVGIASVKIQKRFAVSEISAAISGQLGVFYAAALKAD